MAGKTTEKLRQDSQKDDGKHKEEEQPEKQQEQQTKLSRENPLTDFWEALS